MTAITDNSSFTYGNPRLRDFKLWVDSVEVEFSGDSEAYLADWQEYIDVTCSYRGTVITNEIEPGQFKRAWIEHPCDVKGDPVWEHLAELVYGTDYKFYPGDLHDDQVTMGLEDRLVMLIGYLNPNLARLWEPFRDTAASLYEADGFSNAMGWIVHDFCTHLLMWSYVQDVPLFPQDS